jgi:glycosyltransferase involved in cell wall biosynthesis
MSNALLEAMAAGCACIATDVGETRFVLGGATAGDVPAGSFVPASAGLLVRTGDVAGIVAALRALVDPAVRDALGRAAAARRRENHSIAQVAERYEELFGEILAAN